MSLTPENAIRLEECLAGNCLAVIPTDTVYGLACNPESEAAVRRLYELKGRPSVKPAAVMFFTLDLALRALPELGPRTRAAMNTLLPGPVTLLVPNPYRRYPLVCDPTRSSRQLLTLGLRVPSLAGPLLAIARVRVPAMQSSANFSGDPDPQRLAEVPAALREGADLLLDGGELPGTASTVIDLSEYELSGNWRVVREGPLKLSSLERLFG